MFHGVGIFLARHSGTREGFFSLTGHYGHSQLLTLHISTTGLPIREDRFNEGSLFASRTLPPLRRHPLPRPQSYPLLRPSDWPSSSYRRDDEGNLRCFGLQGGQPPHYPLRPSPLATSSSEGSHDQE